MQINIIAACDRNGIIGKNGKLPFRIKEDMQRFRELTTGNTIICGRHTWTSLPIKPLPNRENIVLCSQNNISKVNGEAIFRGSLNAALSTARLLSRCTVFHHTEDAFIIGGERLYAEALPLADRVYLTLVDTEVEVGAEDTVARFPLEQMKSLFRMEREDKRDGFTFTEWVKK
jgi:dihydrofolate reductase